MTTVLGGALVAGPSYGEPSPPSTSATIGPAQTRGDVVGRRGVPVTNVTVSNRSAVVTARVFWNQAMIALPGHRDRFNVRLVSFGAAGPNVLFSRSSSNRPPSVQHLRITLSKRNARILRRSSDAVLAVSQQYGRTGNHKNKFYRQYATVTQLKQLAAVRSAGLSGMLAGPSTRAGSACPTTEIRPGASLPGCDLSGANLSMSDMAAVNLTGSNLSGAVLTNTYIGGANLGAADLEGVVSGGVTGVPAALPAGWSLVDGVLTGTPPIAYAVTYDGNTATGGTVPVDGSSPYAPGANVLLLGPGSLVKDGNMFLGWNSSADGTGTQYFPPVYFTMPNQAITWYAQWSPPQTLEVIFHANGGTGSMPPQWANVPTALHANTFTRVGYSFTGWNSNAGGTGTAYADGAVYPFTYYDSLHAQWAPNTYTVTYDGNTATGGTVPVDPASPHATDSSVMVLGNTGSLAKAGYTFLGWNTAANGSGTAYAPGATFTMPPNAATLYAQWSNLPAHTVTFDTNGGSGSMAAQVTNVPTALDANTFSRAGYSFTGWNTDAGGTGTAYADGAVYPFAADVTLYAQWLPLPTHAVTFNSNGGSGSMPAQWANVPSALDANTFTRTGFSFAGWNTVAGGTGTAYADGATYPFAADATLYAQWAPRSCASYSVGDTGPGGGTIFYKDPGRPLGSQCFEAAPAGWDPAATVPFDPTLAWGVGAAVGECGNLSIPGAGGLAIGDGAANTAAVVGTAACNDATKAPAAWAAKNYHGGALTDWFLPSLGELNALDASGVSGFISTLDYLSSSQVGASLEWGQIVGYGGGPSYQHSLGKLVPYSVRPVRSF
ncbi:MAG: InlB B-repeat-containing protein [Actinomycetes bacterium]